MNLSDHTYMHTTYRESGEPACLPSFPFSLDERDGVEKEKEKSEVATRHNSKTGIYIFVYTQLMTILD